MGNILYTGGCVSCVVGRVLCTVGYLLCAVGLILCTVGYLLESMGRALAPPASCACAAGLVSYMYIYIYLCSLVHVFSPWSTLNNITICFIVIILFEF